MTLSKTPGRIFLVSELYYPEETSTGYLVTRIAESLAAQSSVCVLCGQPTYSARGTRAPRNEEHHGVRISRCWGTTLNKNHVVQRLVNFVTISTSIFIRAAFLLRSHDSVLVVSNPPLLPYLISFACWMRGSKCFLLVHDVYPEVLLTTRILSEGSWLVRLLNVVTKVVYRKADRIIVIGRDMEKLVCAKVPESKQRIVVIPNWGDVDLVAPRDRRQNTLLKELGLDGKFVIQYAGNMGHPQGIETLVESAVMLSEHKDIHFLFIGSGAKLDWLRRSVHRHKLSSVSILPSRPRSDQPIFLNACDVAIASLVPGMRGVGVPSRMYNIMAAGKPVIAAIDAESEWALVIREEGIGWVIPPKMPEKIVEAILEAQARPDLLVEMGLRARRAVEQKYSPNQIMKSYQTVLGTNDG